MNRLASWLRGRPVLIDVALVAVLVLCATGEFAWAVLAGWPPQVAWAWPVAVDCYAIQAFRARKDVPFAMLSIGASVALAHVLGDQYPKGLPAAWTAGAGLAVPVIFWRIEQLQAGLREERVAAAGEAERTARREQEREDARRATAAQESANRLEADRQQLERDQLEQRDRELAEQRRQERANRPARPTTSRPKPSKPVEDPADQVDSLEPVVWEIAQERTAAGLGRIARDTPKAGTPLGLKDELKARGYPGVGNARAGRLLAKVYGDAEVSS